MKDYARGSEWRKWDLHIHTASSYDAYKGDDSDKLLAKAVCENELDGKWSIFRMNVKRKRLLTGLH